MRPYRFTMDLDDVDADGIAQSQTPGGAGNLTLNGALGTTLDFARKLVITTGADESSRTITVTGTGENGAALVEAITGPNATTGESTGYFKTITTIAIDGAASGTITVGTVDEVVSRCYPIPTGADGASAIQVVPTGTINFTIEETLSDVFSADTTAADYVSISALASKTASIIGSATRGATGLRVKVNSYTNGAELKVNIVSPS